MLLKVRWRGWRVGTPRVCSQLLHPRPLRGGTQVGSLVVTAITGGTREVRRECSTVPQAVAEKTWRGEGLRRKSSPPSFWVQGWAARSALREEPGSPTHLQAAGCEWAKAGITTMVEEMH